ncbi:S-norcoclaurine synthase 1 [Acorus gramineus]|uniref:S-norcoclaurine synthase 1 n=1 Tax=Acorus gramineus TaxID=55184 RepID=A0AAV9AEZ3_ACOGR|nr:S-norcoclaurine synthase 1 [Acorus gramineus]
MEAVEKTIINGSLPVPNVQVLSSKKLTEIPNLYIRPEREAEPALGAHLQQEIPSVDLSKLLDQRFSEEESKKLHLACQEWGFFHLINHGVGGEVMEKVKRDTQEFFKQPLEVKDAHSQLPDSVEGYGQAFVVSQEQRLDWADMLSLRLRPISSRRMRFWPTQPTSFRETLEQYSSELMKVTNSLLGAMAKNLGVDPDVLIDKFKDGMQSARINYYPPCPQPDKALGLSPHSDASGLTILLQINEVQGLQIMKDGNWVPVTPLPDSFVVNVGDVIEILSNGKYKSINHRSTVDPEKERLSIATFQSPSSEADIGPLPELVRDGGEVCYNSMNYGQFLKLFTSGKLDGKGHMQFIKKQKPSITQPFLS